MLLVGMAPEPMSEPERVPKPPWVPNKPPELNNPPSNPPSPNNGPVPVPVPRKLVGCVPGSPIGAVGSGKLTGFPFAISIASL